MSAAIIENLHRQANRLLQLLRALDEVQLNTTPFQDSWTAGQVGEHLYKSYDISGVLNGRLAPTDRSPREKLPLIEELFLNYEKKMASPKALIPTKESLDKRALLERLETGLITIREFAEKQDLSPTCLDFEFPGFGYFTRLEWIGFTAIHTQRHNHQLERIHQALGAGSGVFSQ